MKPIVVVGSLNIDLVLTAERFVAPGETMHGDSFCMVAGGKGANQAAAAARLGYPTKMFGRVGDDGFGPRITEELVATGVDVSGVEETHGSTGTALITTVANGQNSIVIVPGANGAVTAADVERWWPSIREAGIVLAQLEIPMEAVERLATLCARDGVPLMLDPAPAKALRPELLRAITWLTPNESEALALTGVDVSHAEEAALRGVAENLLSAGAEGVVLKLGSRGVYIAQGIHRGWIASLAVNAIDTTAAGDSFNGAFAVSLLQLGDPMAAARVAVAAAALSTTVRGAIPSMPTSLQIETLLRGKAVPMPQSKA